MATLYPIVFEQEESGAYSAYVAGWPVYAQGATPGKAAMAIVRTLGAYLAAAVTRLTLRRAWPRVGTDTLATRTSARGCS
jgi:hypothetical protein